MNESYLLYDKRAFEGVDLENLEIRLLMRTYHFKNFKRLLHVIKLCLKISEL